MAFKISKKDNWHDLYKWTILHDKQNKKSYVPLSPHDINKLKVENENYKKIDAKTKIDNKDDDENKENNIIEELNDRVEDLNIIVEHEEMAKTRMKNIKHLEEQRKQQIIKSSTKFRGSPQKEQITTKLKVNKSENNFEVEPIIRLRHILS
jgi:hypothetical protein